ncbi:MAG: phosphohistidine phosphatase [Armatimonadetes bacterium]|nr:phosphohistidine phosphatase [Armatimonadota bacterium]
MVLLFLRHGEAEKGSRDVSDSQRRLVEVGRIENRLCLEAARRAGARPDAIVTSPLVRAVETADMAAETFGLPRAMRSDERLACGAGLADVREVVAAHRVETLMLVGHNPDFSEVVGELIGEARVTLKTSGMACVTLPVVAPGAGRLEWLIKPSLFARD